MSMKHTLLGVTPVLALVAILLIMLLLMGLATQGSARFGELYSYLLIANTLGLLLLLGLTLTGLFSLARQVRRNRAGARLTARLVLLISLVSVTPVAVVYYFSLKFLHEGIDSWFDVRVENALDDAIELGRTALGVRMREHLKQTELLAVDLADDETVSATRLDNALRLSGASELAVIGLRGQILASSNVDPTTVLPNRPEDAILLQARQGQSYIGLDPVGDDRLYIRVVVSLRGTVTPAGNRVLQALFPVAERMSVLADSVESAHAKYRELAFLRGPLKTSFTLTLSLALVLAVLAALWAALFSARRVVAPLRELAQGTRAVAEGDLETQVGPSGHDEIGFLLSAFNHMTGRLRVSRDETRASQAQVEAQRAYLEAVLERLSTGVMTLDEDGNIFTANSAAEAILGLRAQQLLGEPLEHLSALESHLRPFVDAAELVMLQTDHRHDVTLERATSSIIVNLRAARLASGHLLVFDDITAVVQAQRDAAWSEVARRLAHEIKNPLTPIQLSAERLRYKYLARMSGKDHETLDRLTRTIVQQVEALKNMVNAFSDYARSPAMTPRPIAVNALVEDVCELYKRPDGPEAVRLELGEGLPEVRADADRLRQILHNLVKNAMEAAPDATVVIATEVDAQNMLCLRVTDQGPGFPADLARRVFEPYVTSKTRGSGLGLAIVKRIAEEHGGSVSAYNVPGGGACVAVRLPVSSSAAPELAQEAV
jgi:PAS domain S-box-containing protein